MSLRGCTIPPAHVYVPAEITKAIIMTLGYVCESIYATALDLLRSNVHNAGPYCAGCPQNPIGEKRIPPDGKGHSGILIVGDSPWKDEIKQGRPFVGAAGSYLDKLIRMVGRKREDYVITNAMWCKPPQLNWTDTDEATAAIAQCSPYLDDLVRAVKPKVIMPLGNVALRRVCGVSGIQARQAYVHDSVWGIPAVPTFHPSFIMQGNHKFFGAAAYAFQRAEEIAHGPFKRTSTQYLIDPDLRDASDYISKHVSSGVLVVDIETPLSSKLDEETAEEEDTSYTIVRMSFSLAPFTAVTVPWSEPYISWLRTEVPKFKTIVMWNEAFDNPRLVANGVNINAQVIDAMWMWHFLQSDLPKSLGFVSPFFTDLPAWKHLSESDLPLYSAMDADATFRNYLGIMAALKKQGRWEAFETHCLQTGAILRRMGPRGILIDRGAQASLATKLEAEYSRALAKLQGEVPEAVRNLTTWKVGPKVVTPEIRTEEKPCPDCQGGDQVVLDFGS